MKNAMLYRFVYVIAAIVMVLVAAGCDGIKELRSAQDAFGQGATIENQRAFAETQSPMGDEAVLALVGGDPRVHYLQAQGHLETIDGNAEMQNQLKADKLWAAKESLDALVLWRLGSYKLAIDKAKTTLTLDDLAPRDQILMTALPGLVRNTEATDKIISADGIDETRLAEVEALLVQAYDDIQTARTKAGTKHPVQAYLIQAQMVTTANHMAAYAKLAADPVAPDDVTNRRTKLLGELAKATEGRAGADQLQAMWRVRLGVAVASPSAAAFVASEDTTN